MKKYIYVVDLFIFSSYRTREFTMKKENHYFKDKENAESFLNNIVNNCFGRDFSGNLIPLSGCDKEYYYPTGLVKKEILEG